MSTARNDHLFVNEENYQQRLFSNQKHFNSERKHNIRKQALGEIKNVIHNHASLTPFKGRHVPGPSKNFCGELLKKRAQQLKSQFDGQNQVKIQEQTKKELPTPRTCNKNCHKGLEEIWSEMNVLEPEILERLVNGDGDVEKDLELADFNFAPVIDDFEDELLEFKLENPYERESNKLLDRFLEDDITPPSDLPLEIIDWMDDL